MLFDTWFSNPAQISDVHKLRLYTIAMIQKSEKRKYSFWGNMMTINQIFRTMPKKRGRSSYLLSDEQIQLLVDEFYNKLPSYLQNRLKCKNIAA